MPDIRFEWNEDNRLKNLAERNIDFCDAIKVFHSPYDLRPARSDTEERYLAVGPLGDLIVEVVYVRREEAYRILDARPARPNYASKFREKFSGREHLFDNPH